ncbi:MAG TPA: solute:sodium symporter family transporter [Vicinamibacteria bacterium]|nr:solute:sodium symporter family transporter [Vicinamibacteria bacterium]
MSLSLVDLITFGGFLAVVVGVSAYAGRREKTTEDYFLAGRSLGWWLIGMSLIASNISTEHFVGMAGSAFGRVGLAIASYEWMAAVTLVVVAWWLLPTFLRAGIYTMPEFLEHRYDARARAVMAFFIMVAYVVVALATVLYSGAIALGAIFDLPALFAERFGLEAAPAESWSLVASIWLIGVVAGAYTIYGGLKAVVWSDLIQGSALVLGGALVLVLGFLAIGDGDWNRGVKSFFAANQEKLHTVLPWNDPDMPWLAVFVGGLWIPNLFYWGLNQFITQRTLGARSLAEGQRGIFFAALLKLLIPFIIVFPGLMAHQLYGPEIERADGAYPFLVSRILPAHLRGIMLAALTGAVMSSFNSMLNSASTIFTMDLYARHRGRRARPAELVRVGRWATAVFGVIACLWAPMISGFEGVFTYIQMVWGFITPGIVAAFLFGLVVRKAPPSAAIGAMLLGIPVYAALLWRLPQVAFLHHMAFTFLLQVGFMALISWKWPLSLPVVLPEPRRIDTTPMAGGRLCGWAIICATAALYWFFW